MTSKKSNIKIEIDVTTKFSFINFYKRKAKIVHAVKMIIIILKVTCSLCFNSQYINNQLTNI